MAEVTSGTDLTVIVLNQREALALTRVLNWSARNDSGLLEADLYELYDALNYDALNHEEDN